MKGIDFMTITYEYYNALYVNLTNRCSNECAFCVRTKKDAVNDKDNLWLDREPSIEEIKADFLKRDLSKYSEVVFCGYGEPLMRFDDVIEVSKWLKENFANIKIRINTNGQANMIAGKDVTPLMEGLIDSISISLNTDTADKYQKICKSEFGEAAFEGLQDFAVKASRFVPEVTLSVVDKVLSDDEIENCSKIAEKCGVNFRVREYISK